MLPHRCNKQPCLVSDCEELIKILPFRAGHSSSKAIYKQLTGLRTPRLSEKSSICNFQAGFPVMPEREGKESIITIRPLHVLLVGAGVLGSGILLTASLSYKQAGKQLAAEGIDAGIRRAILPHAFKALSGSLLLTGLAAAGGFYVMETLGLVNSDAPTSTSAFQRAWNMVGSPLPNAGDSQQQQQQQQHRASSHSTNQQVQ